MKWRRRRLGVGTEKGGERDWEERVEDKLWL